MKSPLKFMLLLFAGAMTGSVIFSALRTFYYIIMNYQPNMHPGMFIIFSPIFGVIIFLIAAIIELLVDMIAQLRLGNKYAFILGLSYSAVILLLFGKWLVIAFAIVNPITVHSYLFFKHKSKSYTPK